MQLSIRRLTAAELNPPPPPPPSTTLQTPSFESSARVVPFGETVKVVASSLPAGAVLEYSTDNGNTWTAGSQVPVNNKIDISARVRLNQTYSSVVKGSFTPYFRRLLVIGNSIMFHGPATELGWTNSNGMAASALDKDFVHLLMARLQTINPATTLRLQAGTGLELNFGKPTYVMDEFDEPVQTFKPDLIVIRIGENVSDGDVPLRNLEGQFRQFIDRIIQLSGGQPVRIVTTTSVWNKPQTDAVIRKIIAEKGMTLVDLSSMVDQGQYFASQYANGGVAAHPNDAGMQRITDLIWEKVNQ
ncbi:SGNH/GDSL hydrolase family protein [Spirosoma spitsbergense]|uniref:SGNH/GDSL hydrolase family protein n=1 Tax=Spirosoma spitsbergense TaxID=431554 RepID=UPI0003A0F977|nr:SGNH/GDSL hydrolase family protein [Spirosoma spitsbergense]